MNPSFTLILPTHNPRPGNLPRVLAALARQTLGCEAWEAIVVDNASKPAISAESCRAVLPGVSCVREERLGVVSARLAGVRRARGRYLVLVDDDNLLAPDYLERAREFMEAHPRVGVVGGRIVGEFAAPPPTWAVPHLGSLALRDFGDVPLISYHANSPAEFDYFAPYGAGMVIRTDIARTVAQQIDRGVATAEGRVGRGLSGCEDSEFVVAAWQQGYECAYAPGLRLEHVIPAGRLSFGYLQRLARQGQQSWGEFRRRHGFSTAIPRWTVPLRDLKAFIVHRAWTRSGFIRWRGACGYFAGLAE